VPDVTGQAARPAALAQGSVRSQAATAPSQRAPGPSEDSQPHTKSGMASRHRGWIGLALCDSSPHNEQGWELFLDQGNTTHGEPHNGSPLVTSLLESGSNEMKVTSLWLPQGWAGWTNDFVWEEGWGPKATRQITHVPAAASRSERCWGGGAASKQTKAPGD